MVVLVRGRRRSGRRVVRCVLEVVWCVFGNVIVLYHCCVRPNESDVVYATFYSSIPRDDEDTIARF